MIETIRNLFKKEVPTVREYIKAIDDFKEFDRLLQVGDVHHGTNKEDWTKIRDNAERIIKLYHVQNSGV